MKRLTGQWRSVEVGGETLRAFVPSPLPVRNPPLVIDGDLAGLHAEAAASVERLRVAGDMAPDLGWFLYGFVRKEAVVSSQIEGTQATLADVVRFEATASAENPEDVGEVCNYVRALELARRRLAPSKFGVTTELLCAAHAELMRGDSGETKARGSIRTSQNWIGGESPRDARFTPPPPGDVPGALDALFFWTQADDALPPIVRAGLAHVQFETIHPFLDGNGRIGRLLIALLLEQWGVLDRPLLYLSAALKRRQSLYYAYLSGVREEGDWEGWTSFYLECVRDAAEDGVRIARRLFQLSERRLAALLASESVTVTAIRLYKLLPTHPVITLARAVDLLAVSKPTASKAIDALVSVGVLEEMTGRRRDREYVDAKYMRALTGED